MSSFHNKPHDVLTNDFGFGLNLINSEALIAVVGTGEYGTRTHKLVAEWDDSKGAFPTSDEINAAVAKGNWDRVRQERNKLLDATDWCAHVDSPAMSDEMKTYRQALRDLPASTENSADVVWPEKP